MLTTRISWFNFTKPKDFKKYKDTMFPLGEEQRDKELSLLRSCIEEKMTDQELIYQLLCAKECVGAEDEEDRQELEGAWKKKTLTVRMLEKDQQNMLLFAECIKGIQSLDEYPEEAALKEYLEQHRDINQEPRPEQA